MCQWSVSVMECVCPVPAEHRDQMNAATGFLDASALYGNSEEEARSLQAAEGGLVLLENCRL